MRKRRPDSTARRIAAQLDTREPVRTNRVTRRRIRQTGGGTKIAQYLTPSTSKNLPPQSVTAAAEVIYGPTVTRAKKRPPAASWQMESWQLRKEIPEFRFAGDRVARGASRYKLYAAKRGALGEDPEKVDEGLPYDLCQELFGNEAQTQQGLHKASQHLTFNGESMIVVSDGDGGLTWTAYSVRELTGQGRSFRVNDGIESRNLTDNDIVTRCWSPDPEFSALADCPAQAVLPVARTLRGLGKRTAAEIDSRLAGAGLLIFPEEVDVVSPQLDDEGNEMDVVDVLVEHMTIPIRDQDSAAAVVPLALKVPKEVVKDIQHISFSTPLDEKLPEMETNAIRRIGLGMDSPPETLLGMSTANHWTGWLISSEEVTLVLSPTVAKICHSLTVGWLHPMLEASGVEDFADYMVWFDASELELRPDKSVDSRELHEKGLIGDDAVLRENGFNEKDKPTDEEMQRNLLTRLLIGAPTLAPLLLPKLGIEVDQAVLQKTAEITEAVDGKTVDETPAGDTPKPEPQTGDRTPPTQPTDQPDDTEETGPGQ